MAEQYPIQLTELEERVTLYVLSYTCLYLTLPYNEPLLGHVGTAMRCTRSISIVWLTSTLNLVRSLNI